MANESVLDTAKSDRKQNVIRSGPRSRLKSRTRSSSSCCVQAQFGHLMRENSISYKLCIYNLNL